MGIYRSAGHRKRTQFGWASGVTLTDPDGDMAKLQDDIDRIAANNGQWVRWGIDASEVSSGGGVGTVTWSTPGLTMNDDAIAYARSKGVNVALIMTYPNHASGYSFANFKSTCEAYWTFLATRWAGQIGLWEIFNETNGSHYQTFDAMPFSTTTSNNFPAGYLSELATLIGSASSIIKAVQPGALVSTSLEGYPMSDDIQAEWGYYMDVVGAVLDITNLHIYPDDNATEITAMGTRAAAMRTTYGKPVFVTEFGLPTIGWTQTQQRTYVLDMIASMKAGQVRAMMLYTLRDLSSTPVGGNDAFGIITNSGTPKTGYNDIMAAMGGPATNTTGALAGVAPVPAGALTGTSANPPRPWRAVLVASRPRRRVYDPPGSVQILSPPIEISPAASTLAGITPVPVGALTSGAVDSGALAGVTPVPVGALTGAAGAAAFRAASSNAAFPSTSYTVTTPTGTATGDLLVAIQVGDDGATLASMTATGWTLDNSYAVAGWGFLKVWKRAVSGSPPANYSFGGNSGGGQQCAILAFSSASSTLAVSTSFNDVATPSTSHVLPAAAASSSQVQVSAVYSDWKGTGGTVSWTVASSGMTERIDTTDTYSSLWVGTQDGPTSGTKTITASRSVDYVALSLAVAAA